MIQEPVQHILFVCLGNICRSPMAEGLMRHKIRTAMLEDRVSVDSAGTASWHQGKAPDGRAQATSHQKGISIKDLRARPVIAADFTRFDLILAMDRSNLEDLRAHAPEDSHATIALFCAHTLERNDDVPDPYYGGKDGFQQVFDLLDAGTSRLLEDCAPRR